MNRGKLIFTSGIANVFEWYDYALFGHFAHIIGVKFFPEQDQNTNILQAFLVFALGYLMRPIGGLIFGILGDKFGRRYSLSLSMFCMAAPTAAIGFLPTYESWGISATILMVLTRMLQGLSMGGALTGSISFAIEHSKKNDRGFIGSIAMSGICIGILLGSFVAYIVQSILTEQEFLSFGWRIPFLLGVFIFFVGYYIKKHTKETPNFKNIEKKGNLLDKPLKIALQNYWREILASIMINSTGSVLFYLQAIYLTTYLKLVRGFKADDISIIITFSYMLMAILTIFAGKLSDKIGRKKIFYINLLAIIILTPFMLSIIHEGSFLSVMIATIIIAILAAFYIGPEPALQAELYPDNIRNTALSLSYNISTSLFGGTAPYIIEYLVQNTGSIVSTIYYLIALSFCSFLGLLYYKRQL